MSEYFPISYVFYLCVIILPNVTYWVTPVTIVSLTPTILSLEPYFLFVNGVAVATVILFAPYRFSIHMRRTKAGEEVRRDTFLIIFGISGFAVGEFLFEILLPNYGID